MDCSIAGVGEESGGTGILYDVGSVHEELCKLSNMHKVKGKQYALEMVLLIVVMASINNLVLALI